MPEPSYLYGSHYSTPGFVLYYLVRKVRSRATEYFLSETVHVVVVYNVNFFLLCFCFDILMFFKNYFLYKSVGEEYQVWKKGR